MSKKVCVLQFAHGVKEGTVWVAKNNPLNVVRVVDIVGQHRSGVIRAQIVYKPVETEKFQYNNFVVYADEFVARFSQDEDGSAEGLAVLRTF